MQQRLELNKKESVGDINEKRGEEKKYQGNYEAIGSEEFM